MQTTLTTMRKEYGHQPKLSDQAPPMHPFQWFASWLAEASTNNLLEANAMTLATVDASGQPHARIVLLKGFDDRGLTFFTHYPSHKGEHIHTNPKVALCFFWATQERQVRIEGIAHPLSAAENSAYFAERPRDSQIGAWASKQSQPIASREALEQSWQDNLNKWQRHETIPCPPYWGGYLVEPSSFEFWQGGYARLHDRFYYYLDKDKQWVRERLQP